MFTPFFGFYNNIEWLVIGVFSKLKTPDQVHLRVEDKLQGYEKNPGHYQISMGHSGENTEVFFVLVQAREHGQIGIVPVSEVKFSRLPDRCMMCGNPRP